MGGGSIGGRKGTGRDVFGKFKELTWSRVTKSLISSMRVYGGAK